MNHSVYMRYMQCVVGILVFFFSASCPAQEQKSDNTIELSVKSKNGIAVYPARSVSLTFSNHTKGMASDFTSPNEEANKGKKYFIAIDFVTMAPELFQMLTDFKSEFAGELKIAGKEDKRILQKIEFSGATLDNISSQSTTEHLSTFIYLWCKEINVNGVKLK